MLYHMGNIFYITTSIVVYIKKNPSIIITIYVISYYKNLNIKKNCIQQFIVKKCFNLNIKKYIFLVSNNL